MRRGEDVEIVSTGCRPPSVPHPWMLLLHMQETALWIPPVCCVLDDICKRQLCGFPQWGLLSSRGGGPDNWHQSYTTKACRIPSLNAQHCRTLKQMGYSSRRPHRVPLLSAKNRKRRLQFEQAHQNWTIEDWTKLFYLTFNLCFANKPLLKDVIKIKC